MTELSGLQFETVRHDAFPALNLARKASVEGDDRPIILNAANEVAVEAFLNDQIILLKSPITADCLNQIAKQPVSSINDVLHLIICVDGLLKVSCRSANDNHDHSYYSCVGCAGDSPVWPLLGGQTVWRESVAVFSRLRACALYLEDNQGRSFVWLRSRLAAT